MNKLLSLVLSFCLLFSSIGGIAAPAGSSSSTTDSSDEELIGLVMNYYDLLSGEAGSTESDEQNLTVEQDYQKFKLHYLETLGEQCKDVNPQSEPAKKCAYAKEEKNIRDAYQTAISKQEEIAPNVALQSLSAELFHRLQQDHLLALRFQKNGEVLDPYLKIFPLFHLAQGLDEQTLVGVENVLQSKVKSNAAKCADEDDTTCPLGEAATLAMLSNRLEDAQAVAEVFKEGYNHPQLGGLIVANLGGGLLAMSSQMGNYEAFSEAVVHIIEHSKSGNHTWEWNDFLSMEGWANLVDRWALEPGVFSEGFQYGFYKNEEDKEFSNWFSAWGDLGQELGRLAVARKDSKAAAAANQIITAAHKKDKNHLMLLGMMTQGYYPAKSEEWLKEKARNGMGDLDVPTRLYVREGIYDAYIGLGKSEQQTNEDLHIYKRDTLKYNEYMLDAYNLSVTVEGFKIVGRIFDAALLVLGITSLASIGKLIKELWRLYRWRAPLKAFIVIGKSIKSAAYGKAASWAGKLGKFSKQARYAELSSALRQGIVEDAIVSIMAKGKAHTAATNGYETVQAGIVARKTQTGVRLVRRSGKNEMILDIPEKYQYSSIEDLGKGVKRYRKQADEVEAVGNYEKANQLRLEATEMERLAKQAREFGLKRKAHFTERPPTVTPQSPVSGGGINEEAVAEQVVGNGGKGTGGGSGKKGGKKTAMGEAEAQHFIGRAGSGVFESADKVWLARLTPAQANDVQKALESIRNNCLRQDPGFCASLEEYIKVIVGKRGDINDMLKKLLKFPEGMDVFRRELANLSRMTEVAKSLGAAYEYKFIKAFGKDYVYLTPEMNGGGKLTYKNSMEVTLEELFTKGTQTKETWEMASSRFTNRVKASLGEQGVRQVLSMHKNEDKVILVSKFKQVSYVVEYRISELAGKPEKFADVNNVYAVKGNIVSAVGDSEFTRMFGNSGDIADRTLRQQLKLGQDVDAILVQTNQGTEVISLGGGTVTRVNAKKLTQGSWRPVRKLQYNARAFQQAYAGSPTGVRIPEGYNLEESREFLNGSLAEISERLVEPQILGKVHKTVGPKVKITKKKKRAGPTEMGKGQFEKNPELVKSDMHVHLEVEIYDPGSKISFIVNVPIAVYANDAVKAFLEGGRILF